MPKIPERITRIYCTFLKNRVLGSYGILKSPLTDSPIFTEPFTWLCRLQTHDLRTASPLHPFHLFNRFKAFPFTVTSTSRLSRRQRTVLLTEKNLWGMAQGRWWMTWKHVLVVLPFKTDHQSISEGQDGSQWAGRRTETWIMEHSVHHTVEVGARSSSRVNLRHLSLAWWPH